MLQDHLRGLSAVCIAVLSTGSSIDFFVILVKMFTDDYIFEGLFKKPKMC